MLSNTIISTVIAMYITANAGYTNTKPTYTNDQVECLAKNIYHEARGEGVEGMLMVAEVTMNRVEDSRFPKEVCAVIYQKGQFEWTTKKMAISEKELYNLAEDVAEEVLSGEADMLGTDALYFKSSGIRSKFHETRTYVGSVGGHDFYK